MLTAIKRLTGFGVFNDFAADPALPPFARYNVIYGENGSGKTTLSRLFALLETGGHAEFSDLEFTIHTQSGPLTHGQCYGRKVRVFNSDYIDANIGQLHNPLRHILIVGEENRALADEAASERRIHDERMRAIAAAEQSIDKLENQRGKIFSTVAKTIGEATSGSTLRSYRKPDAEKAFAAAENLAPLQPEELEVFRSTIHQDQLEAVIAPVLLADETRPSGPPFGDQVAGLPASIAVLLQRTAQSGAIARFVQKPEIARWVEDGVAIHEAHASEVCEFCSQPLPPARMARLAEHFGAEDQRLKAEIEDAVQQVSRLAKGLDLFALPPKQALFSELRAEYETACAEVEQHRSRLDRQLEAAKRLLEEKLLHRSTDMSRPIEIDAGSLVAAVAGVAAIIERHNRKAAGFERAKADARRQLERHYLSVIAEGVAELDKEIADQNAIVARLTNGADDLEDQRSLQAIKESYQAKQAAVSSAHAGGAELTDRLKTFLGRTDLRFEPGPDGYLVQRRSKPAKRLSEGEKTAIAFLYFITQLREQDFDLKEGVVVVDDPISSLDSASIYQAFAFLKDAVKDAKQVFILTHNFDFLKILLNWVSFYRRNASYFMIVCSETAGSRNACLRALDSLLIDYPTEYCYLFKVLHGFKSDGTILASYHIPNVARKVLETFLEFHMPHPKGLYEKLDAVSFDRHKKTAIFKFANDLSHRTGKGFDPALVAETQKNVISLLEMIKTVAPVHYEGLEKLAIAE